MSKAESTQQMNTEEAKTFLRLAIRLKMPVMMWGPPGIGKSELVEQLGFEEGRRVIDIRLAQYDPTDMRGIPYFDRTLRAMKWAKPSEFPSTVTPADIVIAETRLHELQIKASASDASEAVIEQFQDAQAQLENARTALLFQNAVIFLDEIVSAPQSVQGAAYQLILNRRIGEYQLPPEVVILAAGNRESDRGVTFQMPKPLANRFAHIELSVNAQTWIEWATNNHVNPGIVGFITAHKQHLFDFDPKRADKSFATPRSWSAASKYLNQLDADLKDNAINEKTYEILMTQVIAANVGTGVASTYKSHFKYLGKLPKPDKVLLGEKYTVGTDEISALYSFAISMCYSFRDMAAIVKDKTEQDRWATNMFDFATQYIKQPEVCILMLRLALRQFNLPISPKNEGFKRVFAEYGKHIN